MTAKQPKKLGKGKRRTREKEKSDPLLRELIVDLNKAGFSTFASCQGKTCVEDYECNRHCEHSFVSFDDHQVLTRRKARARRLGLWIYNGDCSITAVSGREGDAEKVFARNLSFVAKMRELFKLPRRARLERRTMKEPTVKGPMHPVAKPRKTGVETSLRELCGRPWKEIERDIDGALSYVRELILKDMQSKLDRVDAL